MKIKTFPTTLCVLMLVSKLSLACGLASPPATASPAATQESLQIPVEAATATQGESTNEVEKQAQAEAELTSLSYPVVDSGQGQCYDNTTEVACPHTEQEFYGQDAQYMGDAASYQDNGDGTVSDLVTGLMWQADPGDKMTYAQAVAGASSFNLADYNDWRLPTIKELYSLILFDGTDVSACANGTCNVTPFIDTRYFNFQYGDTASGERVIDSQFASSTKYVSTTMNGSETMFGVNFADGRIKGYPTEKSFYVLYVRGNPNYGQNYFVDNGNGTISDSASGLTWMEPDSGTGMNWSQALSYCESASVAGYEDWRLPDVKELQSIVDYSRSPGATNSAAIDPVFSVTAITNEAGALDYPFYWSSTTHADSSGRGAFAAYVAFGEALGFMRSNWMDVHGAGAQRSDPKAGDASEFPQGHGPQGDAVRVDNYVRCVRGGNASLDVDGGDSALRPAMTVESTGIQQEGPSGGQPGGGQIGPQGGAPPQAALDACLGSSQGGGCTFDTPNDVLAGTCLQVGTGQLACVPPGGGANAP